MPSLIPNLVKRVQRLPKPTRTSEALQPLFEAVSNSIHSTQDRFAEQVSSQGQVTITVSTGRRQAPVQIVVEDNGLGLDDRNFEAFQTTDTDNKLAAGGKGVGRLLWLDCFERIHVSSVFNRNGVFWRRDFDFQLALEDQIQNLVEECIEGMPASTGMTIRFDGVRDNGYKARFPGRPTFAFQHLVSHFLPTFIGRRSPRISVHCGDETHHYPDEISTIIKRRVDRDKLETEEYGELSLILMECSKVASADLPGTHFVHFIAHDRTVKSQKIAPATTMMRIPINKSNAM